MTRCPDYVDGSATRAAFQLRPAALVNAAGEDARWWRAIDEDPQGQPIGTVDVWYYPLGSAPVCYALTQAERRRLLDRENRVSSCGSSWGRLERTVGSAAGGRRERLILSLGCGLRECPRCGTSAQSRHLERLHGPWATFVTLTVGSHGYDPAEAVRHLPGALRRWLRMVRDEARRRPAWFGLGDAGRLAYTWTIEPHQDGYPHVHLLTSCEYIPADWLRESWTRAWYGRSQWCDQKPLGVDVQAIRSENGVASYVSKYCSKGSLPPAYLAILGKGRSWSSTIGQAEAREVARMGAEDHTRGRADDEVDEVWRMTATLPGEVARAALESPWAAWPGETWRPAASDLESWGLWSRPATPAELAGDDGAQAASAALQAAPPPGVALASPPAPIRAGIGCYAPPAAFEAWSGLPASWCEPSALETAQAAARRSAPTARWARRLEGRVSWALAVAALALELAKAVPRPAPRRSIASAASQAARASGWDALQAATPRFYL